MSSSSFRVARSRPSTTTLAHARVCSGRTGWKVSRAFAVGLLALVVGALAACGDSDPPVVPLDSGTVVRLDGELPDVSRPSLDAFTSLETGAHDMATPPPALDGSIEDGALADASLPSSDAAATDAGPAGDAGPSCAEIAARYATELGIAQVCLADGDCTELVCDGPCCNCQVYVHAGTAAALRDILGLFAASRCLETLACPDFFCPEPTGVTCYRGACMTSRERAASD